MRLFIVARTAQMIDGRIAFGETHLFVGRGYIVSASATAPRRPTRRCASTARRARRRSSKGEDFILYAILDFIVDNYMPVLETIQDEVEEIEDSVLTASR